MTLKELLPYIDPGDKVRIIEYLDDKEEETIFDGYSSSVPWSIIDEYSVEKDGICLYCLGDNKAKNTIYIYVKEI